MTPYSQMSPYQRRLLALVSASGVAFSIQSELAGLAPRTISDILCGRHTNSTLRVLLSLASHFDVSTDYLHGLS